MRRPPRERNRRAVPRLADRLRQHEEANASEHNLNEGSAPEFGHEPSGSAAIPKAVVQIAIQYLPEDKEEFSDADSDEEDH